MKQYTTEYAYTDNTGIRMYENGKEINFTIVYDWEVHGYCNRLKEEGYIEAYDVDKYKKEMEEAKEEYEWRLELYNKAKKNPLVKK